MTSQDSEDKEKPERDWFLSGPVTGFVKDKLEDWETLQKQDEEHMSLLAKGDYIALFVDELAKDLDLKMSQQLKAQELMAAWWDVMMKRGVIK